MYRNYAVSPPKSLALCCCGSKVSRCAFVLFLWLLEKKEKIYNSYPTHMFPTRGHVVPLLLLCAAAIASSATAVLRGTAVALADASLADGLDGNDTEVQELLLDRCGWLLPITPGDQPYTKTCQRNLCCSAGGFCGSTPAHCLITNDCQKGEQACQCPARTAWGHGGVWQIGSKAPG